MSLLRSIVAIAALSFSLPASVASSTTPAKAAGGQFEEVFDLGSTAADSPARHTFSLANTGSTPLKIAGVHSSCKCVEILSYPELIPARKKGEIGIRLIPSDVGAVSCTIEVDTDATPKPTLRYGLKGQIVGKLPAKGSVPWGESLPDKLLTRKVRKPDTTLAIPPASIPAKNGEKQESLLIDVRDSARFEKFRIPRSLNIPLYAIGTKTFLKNRRLILVSEGYDTARIEKECRSLRSLGFMAWILEGGLAGWKRKGGALEGSPPAQEDLKMISPQSFFEERHYSNWLALNACTSGKKEADYLIPESSPIEKTKGPGQSPGKIEAILAGIKKESSPMILIINDEGKGFEGLERSLKKAGVGSVFILQGGIRGYRAFLKEQENLVEPKDASIKAAGKCSGCP